MKKGFTLIELLIVIAILAILAVAAIIALNPAQLLAQARDSQRLSDLSAIQSAINLYLTTVASPTLAAGPNSTVNATCGFTTCTVVTSTAVTGTGWVPVDLTLSSGGSPLATLPMDPTGNATYQYAYKGDSTNLVFELNGRLESTKFRGSMSTDGGDDSTCSTFTEATCYYEIGTDPGLNL